MSKIGPSKAAVLIMELYEGIKKGDRKEVEAMALEIRGSGSQTLIE